MSEQYKIIRDPIYGYIGLTHDEVRLMNTQVFQRLRRWPGNGRLPIAVAPAEGDIA